MEVQYQCTRADYLEAMANQKKGFLFYLYWVVGVFFLVTGSVSLIAMGWSHAFRIFLIATAALAWPVVFRPLSLRRHFKNLPNFALKQYLVAGEIGLHIT